MYKYIWLECKVLQYQYKKYIHIIDFIFQLKINYASTLIFALVHCLSINQTFPDPIYIQPLHQTRMVNITILGIKKNQSNPSLRYIGQYQMMIIDPPRKTKLGNHKVYISV